MSTPSSNSDPGGSPPGAAQHHVVLELHNVGLSYWRGGSFLRRGTRFWAIQDVSLEIRAGETLGIIGRNGAGKSSLLRLLAGIIQPDRGRLVNHGYQPTLLSLQVGFVPHLSGRKNAILSGLLLGLTLGDILDRMDQIIAFAELEDFIDEPIQTYSSGMRARLGFSTAFFVNADILLIDEVLGVGDAAFVQKSKEVMGERIRSDKTVVLVSHSANQVRQLADRVVWIDKGRVAMEGDPEEVLETYLESTRR